MCGADWNPRVCQCPHWDEERLENRAREVAIRRDPLHRLYQPPREGALDPDVPALAAEPPVIPADNAQDADDQPAAPPAHQPGAAAQPDHPPPEVFQRQVEEIARKLEEEHECDHGKWRWIGGSNRCEECGDLLPYYIFECRQCQLWACNRCRRNRL